ncbi:MAG: NADPH-dependent assimilatory sulfite reductase hemoprotein subunit [Actinomycetota bacterium]|nr:NADPH-dependent assimilatory sulfite reductase hemoprotein subunit [Actinomycetota bacterium]
MSAEDVKAQSRHLRGTVAVELAGPQDAFTGDTTALLKFHGIYQQDDRDVRRQRTAKKLPLDYSCMVRAAVPRGRLTAERWLALDRLAERTDGTLRLTTRQGVQLHFVRKPDLRQIVHDINDAGLSTLAACGDVVRNIMACPDPRHDHALDPVVAQLVTRFRPATAAYWELFIDGEKAASLEDEQNEYEPVYGDTYLPRKFKIGVAWPGDNCVDVFSNDVGIVPTLADGTSGEITGYVVLVGGGLGRSINRDDTYPRLGTPLAWVVPGELVDVVEHVVTTQRDHGNRDDRKRARLKYLIDERGIEWLRSQVEAKLGRALSSPVTLPEWHPGEHHGATADTMGLPVPSGRVTDREGVRLRTALRLLAADGLIDDIRVTPRQDLLFVGVDADRRRRIAEVLREHGVALPADVSPVRRLSIACPALPTCGQALGEAERVLPDVVDTIEALLVRHGIADEAIRVNMTGCPNGCARPYTSEIGISGRTKKTYDLYLGGSAAGTRLGVEVRSDMALDELEGALDPVVERFAAARAAGSTERFGEWCARIGGTELTSWLPEPTVRHRQRLVSAR